jgi:hypothetical protein
LPSLNFRRRRRRRHRRRHPDLCRRTVFTVILRLVWQTRHFFVTGDFFPFLTFKFGSTFLQRKSQRHQNKNLNGGTVVELSARDP